jgi:hypothetical protein
MRFGADRHALLDLEIEQDLIGVKSVAEIPQRFPIAGTKRMWAMRSADLTLQHAPAI